MSDLSLSGERFKICPTSWDWRTYFFKGLGSTSHQLSASGTCLLRCVSQWWKKASYHPATNWNESPDTVYIRMSHCIGEFFTSPDFKQVSSMYNYCITIINESKNESSYLNTRVVGEFFASTAVSSSVLAPGSGATEVTSRLAKQCHGAEHGTPKVYGIQKGTAWPGSRGLSTEKCIHSFFRRWSTWLNPFPKTGAGKCPFSGILNITKPNMCWRLYPLFSWVMCKNRT